MAIQPKRKAGAKRPKAKNQAVAPQVTIVVSFRERWRFTADTVESILHHSRGDFALWVLDPGMPAAVRTALRPHVDAGALRIVPIDQGQQPNEWRASIIPQLSSPYVIFIDNDVVVRPGWLDKLIACADETGAGIVCPLYLWGETDKSDVIHMAGGLLTLEAVEGGTRMAEAHRHVGKHIWEVPQDLHRQTCGFGEFHCLLMRREVYSAKGMFDPGIVTVHEHIHASMLARELGYETWFEPESRVTYLAFAPWQAGEANALRKRWDFDQAERSLSGFAERWNVIDDDEYRAGIHRFLGTHAGHTDLLDPRPTTGLARENAMSRDDVQNTLAGLQLLALQRGYDIGDVRKLTNAYKLAAGIVDGLYRPCGRPFVNHLAGTASVLLFYGCAIPHVIAGLMHAVLTHGPQPMARQLLAQYSSINTVTEGAGKLVRQYGNRSRLIDGIDAAAISEIPVDTAALVIIDAANEVDMHLSWEVAMTRRTDTLPDGRFALYQQLLPYVGLPGLAETLCQIRDSTAWPGVQFEPGLTRSIRFTKPGQSTMSVRSKPAPASASPALAIDQGA